MKTRIYAAPAVKGFMNKCMWFYVTVTIILYAKWSRGTCFGIISGFV